MDWAGTAVDYGCFAPVAAFVESFKAIGAPVTAAETRAHMGLTKIEEVRALFAIDHVKADFRAKYGRDWNEDDVQECYKKFQKELFSTLEDYSRPIPKVVDVISSLRKQGIKVGSTTGYTREMMDVVIPAAAKLGYVIDNCETSDNLPGGRPKPYMIYLAAGQCTVQQASVAELPFEAEQFDVVTAFETVYFWPDLAQNFREVYRVLKPGGIFFICNEANGETAKDDKWTQIINGMTIYTDTALKAYLEQAGFCRIQSHKNKKGWLCVTARK